MIDPVQVKGAAAQSLPGPGRYRHFKGSEYELLMVARHSETEELLAVYRAVEEPERIWVRPLEMFAERVNVSGSSKLRFEPTDEPSGNSAQRLVQRIGRFIQRFGRTNRSSRPEVGNRGYSGTPSLR